MVLELRRVVPVFLLFAAACSSTEGTAQSEDAVVEGRDARPGTFPSTVGLAGILRCTATKVGPKLLLTAAHCVSMPEGDALPLLSPNRKIDLLLRSGSTAKASLTIEEIHLHPRFVKACEAQPWTDDAFVYDSIPDVAVIETKEEILDVPIASVDTTTAAANTAVTLNGYGCFAHDAPDPGGVLRYGDTRTTAMSTLAQYEFSAGAISNMDASYSLAVSSPHAPAICEGDSGGPLYRKGSSVVVGVNSTTIPASGDAPAFNWFTRVDGGARYGIAAWLESLGVTMTSHCDTRSCTAISDE